MWVMHIDASWSTTGSHMLALLAGSEVLKREYGVDEHVRRDAGVVRMTRPGPRHATTRRNIIHWTRHLYPDIQADGCLAEVEPAELDRC